MSGPVSGQGMEAIAVRRAKVTDAGKARYRVYSSPTDFIAVIAENALMAVKVAGVADPYRIVRDLPTEGVTLEAERIAKQEAIIERVNLATTARGQAAFKVEMKHQQTSIEKFVPIKAGDLQKKSLATTQWIVSSETMNSLIDKKKAATPPPQVKVMPPPSVSAPPQEAFAPAPLPAKEIPEPVIGSPPSAPAPKASDETLSPEEVEKLLNG